MNVVARVVGVALAVGLALFLLTLVLKILLAGSLLFLLVRVVGPRLLGRSYRPLHRGGWSANPILSIDNPAHQSAVPARSYERVISID